MVCFPIYKWMIFQGYPRTPWPLAVVPERFGPMQNHRKGGLVIPPQVAVHGDHCQFQRESMAILSDNPQGQGNEQQ